MNAPPYQKLFWGSYHKHTAHLRHAKEHGAYLLLIGALWNNEGRLPADDVTLAAFARLSTKEWQAVKPKLMPLFRVVRGKLTQPRVTEDLAKYRDTSGKRKEAGKAGGMASVGKRALIQQANATGLPTKPEPESKKETPSPQGGDFSSRRFAKALLIAADAGCEFGLFADGIHKIQPLLDGKRRSTLPDVQRALTGALKRGGMPSLIWHAVRAYYALPATTKDGGQFASGAAVILNRDRWKEYLTPAAAAAGPTKAPIFDNPDVRASIVKATDEDFARRFVDHYCRWDAEHRTLEAKTDAVGKSLIARLSAWAARTNVTITVAQSESA